MDVAAVIRYFVVHNFTCNGDSYTGSMVHNYYLYEKDGKLSMLPWDYNLAFGGFQSDSSTASLVNEPIDTPVSAGTMASQPMLAWIFESEEYTALYHQCFAAFIEGYFTSGRFEAELDGIKAMISPYVESDPTRFCTYEEFEVGIDTLKQFCLLRSESIKGQLDGTIPSTSDGQRKNSSALVDASSITVSAMGTMQNGAMDGEDDQSGFPQMPGGNQTGGAPSQPPGGSLAEPKNMPQMPDGGQEGYGSGSFPPMSGRPGSENNSGNFGQFSAQQGEGENRPTTQEGQSPDDSRDAAGGGIGLTLVSVVVLLGGSAAALLYKRKGY